MQAFTHYFRYSFVLLAAFLLAGCEPDPQQPGDAENNGAFTVKIAADKTIGHGQYRKRVESGNALNVPVQVKSDKALRTLKITKTINLAADQTFGTKGTMEVAATGSSLDYALQYTPTVAEVDQLVGFTFEAINTAGESVVSDLTVQVTLSPADNLPRKRWALSSIYHVNAKEEVIKECEKDNSMLLNADGTTAVLYGTDTGAGDCVFDGFNQYTEWSLSADQKIFTRKYYGIFSPNVTVTEEFEVETLTVDKLVLKQTMDLSAFGLSTEETFLFTYDATTR